MVPEEFVYPIAGNLDGAHVVTNDALICGRIKSAAANRTAWRIDVSRHIREVSNLGSSIGAFSGGRNDFLTPGK